jgi:hypothetical protein
MTASRVSSREEDGLPQEAWTAQFTLRLRDMLLELEEAEHARIVVKRVTEQDVVIEPTVIRVVQLIAPASRGASQPPDLYDERGLPLTRDFPGAGGQLQARLLAAPAGYKLARWLYRALGGKSPRWPT